jgi:hypothetical protein
MANARTEEQESARQQLIDAVKAWRETRCLYARAYPPGHAIGDDSLCVGDNHLEECPVESARQDLIASHNKVEQLRAG